MASKGKIDFQTFSDAAASAAGTVATEMGTTVPGAFANLKASIGRIGANLLDGVFGKLGPSSKRPPRRSDPWKTWPRA